MLELFFYLIFIALLVVMSLGFHRAGSNWRTLWIGAALWVAYISLLAHFGVFRDFSLPPRIPLLLVLPAITWIFWYYKTGRQRSLLNRVPRWQPVAFQTFRIAVEFMILGVVLRGIGPKEPSMEGYNYDIITGLTAPLIAIAVYHWKVLSEKWVFWWNIMGLLWLVNVVFIFISLGVAPQIWGYDSIPISPDFGQMPYLLIPGFFMPSAVFMHVFSLMQLKGKQGHAAEHKVPNNP